MLLIRTVLINFIFISFVYAQDIWVNTIHGNDTANGLSENTALRTIQAATLLATPGSTVHIQSGIYREHQLMPQSGTSTAPIHYQAETDQVFIRGSENAATLTWQPLTEREIALPAQVDISNIIWIDLSNWQLTEAPHFIVQLDEQGNVIKRFHLAREPDWQVTTEWKQHEFWWSANGGAQIANCDPRLAENTSHCDSDTRSSTQLIDNQDDELPENIEKGNLTTLGDLTQATLVTIDAAQGNYLYHRHIMQHEITQGKIIVDQPVEYPTFGKIDNPGLGWGSKYYVENHPALLDMPGEYWFDSQTQRLYFWLPEGVDLAQIEISRYDVAWDLSHRSDITLTGLHCSFFNKNAIQINNGAEILATGSQRIILEKLNLNYVNQGITIQQSAFVTVSDNVTRHVTVQNSTLHDIDSKAILLQGIWDNVDTVFAQAPISEVSIKNNYIHHVGLQSDTEAGAAIAIYFPDHDEISDNYLHDIAHNGIFLTQSAIQSDKTSHFSPDEIRTGKLLIRNNLIENSCQLLGDCGAIKFDGQPPHRHVFRDVLVMGNTLRDNHGWSYVAEQRRLWNVGQFAFGVYSNYTSGLSLYRNVIYNNGLDGVFFIHQWCDGEIIIANNLLANQYNGIEFWNRADQDSEEVTSVEIVNNILFNNANYGIIHTANVKDSHFVLDYNLYFKNGWNSNNSDRNVINNNRVKAYLNLTEVQAQTDWESNGFSKNPLFINSEQSDFNLTHCSAAIDRSTILPTTLQQLLTLFAITDVPQTGTISDVGPYEYTVSLTPNTAAGLSITTGESLDTDAQFDIRLINATSQSVTTIQAAEPVILQADLAADSCDIGRAVDIIMVAAYQPQGSQQSLLFMRQGEQWQYWNGLNLKELMPALTETTLESQNNLPIYAGSFQNLLGQFTIYVGYRRLDGGLIFNGTTPLQFVVQE